MKNTYTIPEERREAIEKLMTRYQKKAAKYGAPLTVEYSAPRAVTVPIFDTDGCTRTKVDEIMVEAFDLTVDGEIIRKDGYEVVARIEHLEGGNMVNAFGAESKAAWREAPCRCEHCGTNRERRLTYIVRHEDGTEKQVGRSCLKDYCGIDPQMIGARNELDEILLDEDVERYDFGERPIEPAYNVVDVLALGMRVIRRQGYVKSDEPSSNKCCVAQMIAKRDFPTDEERAEAETLAQAINAIEADDAAWALLDNAQTLVRSGYCKARHFGFLAYAPVAYEKYLDEMKRRAEREAAKTKERASEYVGEIGKRIDVAIAEMKLVTSWENQWGATFLYKFTDTDGNVLVWFASKPMERVNENGAYEDVQHVARIRATVKDHNERDGVKQTIITRCKAA